MSSVRLNQVLFVQNFRGFASDLIPLGGVNFLVGENSTGKTSVLELLNILLSGSMWWNRNVFTSDVCSFPHFADIVTAGSGADSFCVGLFEEMSARRETPRKTGLSNHGVLLRFENFQGLPQVTRVLVVEDEIVCDILRLDGRIKFRTSRPNHSRALMAVAKTMTDAWGDGHVADLSGYTDAETSNSLPSSLIDLFFAARDKAARMDAFEIVNHWMSKTAPVWIAPIRTKPRRTYDEYRVDYSPEGDHTPFLLKSLLAGKEAKAFETGLNAVGRESGLFDAVRVKPFGDDDKAPFELDIVLGTRQLSIKNVGYGVSQALPIVTELIAGPPRATYAVQQPEVHLHPRAQAALGELLFHAAATGGKQLVVETHSDFLIDRFRLACRRHDYTGDAKILFFERRDDANQCTAISLDKNGMVVGVVPESYRQFFLREQLDLLAL